MNVSWNQAQSKVSPIYGRVKRSKTNAKTFYKCSTTASQCEFNTIKLSEHLLLQTSHTDDCSVQILRLLPVPVTELSQNHLQNLWIWSVQNKMFQKPGRIKNKSWPLDFISSSVFRFWTFFFFNVLEWECLELVILLSHERSRFSASFVFLHWNEASARLYSTCNLIFPTLREPLSLNLTCYFQATFHGSRTSDYK